MRDILVYGAGGLGLEVKTVIEALHKEWRMIGFIDDYLPKGTLVAGKPIMGGASCLFETTESKNVVLAFGLPSIKAKVLQNLYGQSRIFFPTLVHPSAVLCDPENIRIGAGTIITAGAVLTTEITIGEHVLVNLNATIGHNVVLGSFSSIMPGCNVAGAVTIGKATLIGSGANILNGIKIGNHSTVGSGSVVLKDIGDGETVVGVPAKEIRRNEGA